MDDSHHQPAAESGPADASVKAPVLVLLAFAVLWLLTGSALALIASIKLHTPSFLDSCVWFTYGRIYPAALNALVYGWGFNVAFAVIFWLIARLARAELRGGGLLIVAVVFWNIGVKLGVGSILAGYSTSLPWLEMPRYVTPLLLVVYTFMAAWAVATLRSGRATALFVSQWWLLGALFWFPWIYATAQLMLVFAPAPGTLQAIVNVWFAHNLASLWFVPVGLAAIYYFLPKLLGKALSAYYLAPLGFWSFALFASIAGTARLLGSPVPGWVSAAGAAACFMLLLPLVIIALNFFTTLCGHGAALKTGSVLRFIVFGALVFVLTTVQTVTMAVRGLAEITQFTYYTLAHDQAVLYGFFSMVMFGAVYYLVPRLLRREWPSAALIRAHFWASALGLVVLVGALSLGGWQQGVALNTVPAGVGAKPVAFLETVRLTIPWLQVASCAGVLLIVGHLAFAVNFVRMLMCPRHLAATAAKSVPTELLQPAPELQASAR